MSSHLILFPLHFPTNFLCSKGALTVLASRIHILTASYYQGYKNQPNFLKFGENRRNQVGPNLKTVEIIVHYFKTSEKDKNQ
jgi:hypothetical protein